MENYATKNTDVFLSARRFPEYEEIGICRREPFQRDRDRIMHSRSFRRMMHKTQIFNANIGDHYRNRLTHTLEVAQISRSIGKVLGLNDELIEAIALGHDLGHTPFGHIGERTLDGILHNGLNTNIPATGGRFKHNFQSLKVVDQLETRCEDYAGINLTLATREGILKHTKTAYAGEGFLHYPELDFSNIDLSAPSFTLEGQVVAISDEIAQCTHDLEDGVRSKIISFSDIQNYPLVLQVIKKYVFQDVLAYLKTRDDVYSFDKSPAFEQVDSYYDTPDKLVESAKSTLRIRHKDCNYEITIKCPTPVQIKDNGQNERFEFCHPISSNSLSGEEAFIVEHVPSLKDKTSELKNTLTIINKREIINILAKKSEAKFEMAFDHVTYQDDSGHKAYDYQIEIELKSDYIHRVNLKMLTDDLEREVSKLESSTESKYKRGLTKLSVQ